MILITRPQNDAKSLSDILEKLGYQCLSEPMMEIKQLNIDLNRYINNDLQAFVLTSSNVILPKSYKTIIKIPQHGKNARELLEYIKANLSKDDGKIIHLSGNVITLDIAAKLRDEGFDAENIITYETEYADKLSAELINNLENIKIATFFSILSLKNFVYLIDKYRLSDKLKNIKMVCLSEKIAQSGKANLWKEIIISDQPNQQSLIDRLQETHNT
ncbi:MAG: hypothetical protein COV36_04080 [Alphaproteobacteria bacterium CG11_big_fil_rev_8_21_14_0_20_44_7]|nr:MAG: hypothetical protein COV36_04080 [Alphaproteobacteria bacterium CG11_big_fil_rev_8_21_14_0_20_44_7]